MEQLAHFVTKSFEYNNNRVMDLLNISTKSEIYPNDLDSCSNNSEIICDNDDEEDDDASIEIELTDLSTNLVVKKPETSEKPKTRRPSPLPLSLIKRSSNQSATKDTGRRCVTKNWLIPTTTDPPKRNNCENADPTVEQHLRQLTNKPATKFEDVENSVALNLIRVNESKPREAGGLQAQHFRPKPVAELLKRMREIKSCSPLLEVEKSEVEKSDEERVGEPMDGGRKGEWILF
jgi:hypothetical protein